MASPRTVALIEGAFPRDIAKLIHNYFISKSNAIVKLARNGNYEACKYALAKTTGSNLYGACHGGYPDIIDLMIERGEYWEGGLHGACRGGHLDVIEWMIARGATNWNSGLSGACRHGHLEIAELMIKCGATGWSGGLTAACKGNHRVLIKLMISQGATECWHCNKSIGEHPIA